MSGTDPVEACQQCGARFISVEQSEGHYFYGGCKRPSPSMNESNEKAPNQAGAERVALGTSLNCGSAAAGESPSHSGGMPFHVKVALWNAINDYTEAVGGDPAIHFYGNTKRQKAVVAVESIIEQSLLAAEERGRQEAKKEAILKAVFTELEPQPECKESVELLREALGLLNEYHEMYKHNVPIGPLTYAVGRFLSNPKVHEIGGEG